MSQAHLSSRLALQDVLVPVDSSSCLWHFDNHLNSTQGIKPVFDKIRYIRDYLQGNTVNTTNHWVEIQAYDTNGVNVALGKPVLGDTTSARITDGITDSSVYAGVVDASRPCYVEIDLGNLYDISYIKVWHYYADGRTYYNTRTDVSHDYSHWITVFNSGDEGEYQETAVGHLIDVKKARLLYDGVYDSCVGIFESTTNLIKNGNVITNLTNWFVGNDAGSNGAIARVYDEILGKYVYQYTITVKAGWGSYFGNSYNNYAPTPKFDISSKYTISFLARSVGSNEAMNVSFKDGNGSNIVWSAGDIALTNDWKFFSYTFTPSIAGNAPVFYCRSDSSAQIRIVDLQLEKSEYTTPFVGSSRANYDFLQYDLPYAPKSYAFWMKFHDNVTRADTDRYVMTLQDDIASNYWQLYAKMGTKDLYLEVVQDHGTLERRYCMCYNSGSNNNVKDVFDGNWHFINIWFDQFYAYLKVDNVLIQSRGLTDTDPRPFSKPISFDSTKLGIGCHYNSINRPGNVYIDELRLDNRIYNPQDYALKCGAPNRHCSLGIDTTLTNYTLEMLIYYASNQNTTTSYPTLFNRGPQSGTAGYWWSYTNGTDKSINWQYADGSSPRTVGWSNVLDYDKYTWLSFVYDHTAKTITLYKNGSLVSTLSVANAMQCTSNTLYIGQYQGNGSGYALTGNISQVRLWNKVLTSSEITSYYNIRLVGDEANLSGYWTFDEGTGIAAYDHTSNHRDGALAGGAEYTPYNADTDEADAWMLSNKPYYDPYDYSIEVF
jgi:hypothetical protein